MAGPRHVKNLVRDLIGDHVSRVGFVEHDFILIYSVACLGFSYPILSVLFPDPRPRLYFSQLFDEVCRIEKNLFLSKYTSNKIGFRLAVEAIIGPCDDAKGEDRWSGWIYHDKPKWKRESKK